MSGLYTAVMYIYNRECGLRGSGLVNGSGNGEGISEWNQLSPLLERRSASSAVLNGRFGRGGEEVARRVQFSAGSVPERMQRSRSRMWPLVQVLVIVAGLSCGEAQDGESLATSFLSGKSPLLGRNVPLSRSRKSN